MEWSRRRFLYRGLPLGLALLGTVGAFSRDEELKQDFKLPEGRAARTLKLAARQAGVDIVFSAEVVKGVRTHAVSGKYSLSEVFQLMLQGSLLVAVKHQKSGVYLIEKRKTPVEARPLGFLQMGTGIP